MAEKKGGTMDDVLETFKGLKTKENPFPTAREVAESLGIAMGTAAKHLMMLRQSGKLAPGRRGARPTKK